MLKSRSVLGTAALALMALGHAAQASTVTLNQSPYSSGPGGEFNATPNSFPFIPVQLTAGSFFETFCLEAHENFQPGGTYEVSFDTFATGGGGGAVAGMDFLDERTAFLYSAFITGTLPQYDYPDSLGQRQADAGALQNAIWFLEDEAATLDTPLANFFYAYSAGGIGQGIGNVLVVNLYTIDATGAHIDAQSQIVKRATIPAPSAGLLALSALGLTTARRRRAAR